MFEEIRANYGIEIDDVRTSHPSFRAPNRSFA